MWVLYTTDKDSPNTMIRFIGEYKTKKEAKAELQKIWENQPLPRKDIFYKIEKE